MPQRCSLLVPVPLTRHPLSAAIFLVNSMCWGDEASLIEPTHEIYTGADPSNLHRMSYLEGVFLKKDRKAPRIAWCRGQSPQFVTRKPEFRVKLSQVI